jgi:hypothetical protein
MWKLRIQREKNHLEFPSLHAWGEARGIREPLLRMKDAKKRDRLWQEACELRQHLYKKHLETLTAAEQELFKQGKHPSQSHAFAKAAKPYAESLYEHIRHLDYVKEVSLGWGQGGLIKLTVHLGSEPNIEELRKNIPWLYHGFVVGCVVDPDQNVKPVPTFVPVISLE